MLDSILSYNFENSFDDQFDGEKLIALAASEEYVQQLSLKALISQRALITPLCKLRGLPSKRELSIENARRKSTDEGRRTNIEQGRERERDKQFQAINQKGHLPIP